MEVEAPYSGGGDATWSAVGALTSGSAEVYTGGAGSEVDILQ